MQQTALVYTEKVNNLKQFLQAVACLQGRPARPGPTQFSFDCLVLCDRKNLP
jgi:hypothetical protein